MLRPATPLAILLFAAFAMLLLAVISTPIIQAIPLAAFDGVTFGVFGYCAGSTCTPIEIGYDACKSLLSCVATAASPNLRTSSILTCWNSQDLQRCCFIGDLHPLHRDSNHALCHSGCPPRGGLLRSHHVDHGDCLAFPCAITLVSISSGSFHLCHHYFLAMPAFFPD
jgi:hypothetical protein